MRIGRVLGGVAVVLGIAAIMVIATTVGGGNAVNGGASASAAVSRGKYTEAGIRKLALQVATDHGDPYPTSIRYVFSRSQPAEQVVFGDTPSGRTIVALPISRASGRSRRSRSLLRSTVPPPTAPTGS